MDVLKNEDRSSSYRKSRLDWNPTHFSTIHNHTVPCTVCDQYEIEIYQCLFIFLNCMKQKYMTLTGLPLELLGTDVQCKVPCIEIQFLLGVKAWEVSHGWAHWSRTQKVLNFGHLVVCTSPVRHSVPLDIKSMTWLTVFYKYTLTILFLLIVRSFPRVGGVRNPPNRSFLSTGMD